MKFKIAFKQLKHASKNPGTLPSIKCMKTIVKKIKLLQNEIEDAYCLAYNSLPDREIEDQEDDLCAQIYRLTEYIQRQQPEIERLRKLLQCLITEEELYQIELSKKRVAEAIGEK